MNDTELDAMLKTWEAPEPSSKLREAVRQSIPHEPKRHTYRWLAAAATIAVTAGLLIIAMPGSGHAQLADGSHGSIHGFFEGFHQTIQERHLQFAMWLQSLFEGDSQPKLYVDGVLAHRKPRFLSEGRDTHIFLPDQGIYVMTLPPPKAETMTAAGKVKGTTAEFQWEGKAYRIVTAKPMTPDEQPVYVLHYADFHRLRGPKPTPTQ